MLLLDTKNQSLLAVTLAGPVTTQPTFSVSYAKFGTDPSENERLILQQNISGRLKRQGELTGTTEKVLVSAPDDGTIFNYKIYHLSIFNNDTAPIGIKILSRDLSVIPTDHIEWMGTLDIGEFVVLDNRGMWNVYAANGVVKRVDTSGGIGTGDLDVRNDGALVDDETIELNFYNGITATSVGVGLVQVNADYAGSGGDYGMAVSLARSDHIHDTRYYTQALLGSVLNAEGASLIGIEDATAYYTGATVEAALQEIGADINVLQLDLADLIADLASTAPGEGASLIGIEDSGGYYTSTDVEGALVELITKLNGYAVQFGRDAQISTPGTYLRTADGISSDPTNSPIATVYNGTLAAAAVGVKSAPGAAWGLEILVNGVVQESINQPSGAALQLVDITLSTSISPGDLISVRVANPSANLDRPVCILIIKG